MYQQFDDRRGRAQATGDSLQGETSRATRQEPRDTGGRAEGLLGDRSGESRDRAAEAHGDALDPREWERAVDEFRRALEHARQNPIGG